MEKIQQIHNERKQKKITRKHLITMKYIEFQNELKPYINSSIFPNIEDVDIVDIIFYLNTYFLTKTMANSTVKHLLKQNKITLDENKYNELMDIIYNFMDWYHNMK